MTCLNEPGKARACIKPPSRSTKADSGEGNQVLKRTELCGNNRGKTSLSAVNPKVTKTLQPQKARMAVGTLRTALRKAESWERIDSAPSPGDWCARPRAETESALYKYS